MVWMMYARAYDRVNLGCGHVQAMKYVVFWLASGWSRIFVPIYTFGMPEVLSRPFHLHHHCRYKRQTRVLIAS